MQDYFTHFCMCTQQPGITPKFLILAQDTLLDFLFTYMIMELEQTELESYIYRSAENAHYVQLSLWHLVS